MSDHPSGTPSPPAPNPHIVFRDAAPQVDLNRIDRIVTFEVMEDELSTLDQIVSDENKNLGFLSAMGGVFLSVGATLLTTPSTPVTRFVVLLVVTTVSFVFTLWFGIGYRDARKRRPEFINKIRTRSARRKEPPPPVV